MSLISEFAYPEWIEREFLLEVEVSNFLWQVNTSCSPRSCIVVGNCKNVEEVPNSFGNVETYLWSR